jgi:hypothetical protein
MLNGNSNANTGVATYNGLKQVLITSSIDSGHNTV